MSPPDAERGPEGPRPESAAAKLTDAPRVPRTTWDGHPGLSVGHDRYVRNRYRPEPAAIDAAGVAVLEGELAELLGGVQHAGHDPEAVAYALVDRYGPSWCRRLAGELDQAVADVLGDRRTPWGGGGR